MSLAERDGVRVRPDVDPREHSEKRVRFANPTLQAGFVSMPTAILRSTRLSTYAKVVWGLLASYAWQDDACWPGQDRLCEFGGMSESTLRKAMNELVDAKLLVVTRRGLGLTNLYVLSATIDDRSGPSRNTGPEPGPTPDAVLTHTSNGSEPSPDQGEVKAVEVEAEEVDSDTLRDRARMSPDRAAVDELWAFWQQKHPTGSRLKLTAERRKIIRTALSMESMERCKTACERLLENDWHGERGFWEIKYALRGGRSPDPVATIDRWCATKPTRAKAAQREADLSEAYAKFCGIDLQKPFDFELPAADCYEVAA